MSLDEYLEDNRSNWNDRATVHADSDMYGFEKYKADPARISSTVAFDEPRLGDIRGISMAHLQCHLGTDTISLNRLGAEVVGLDFAPNAIEAARRLAADSGSTATFVEASVYDAVDAVGRTVDYVYTSIGTICWLAELDRWAAAVAGLLEAGGRFYIRDVHPSLFPWDEVDGSIVPKYDYFTPRDEPLSWDEAETYADGDTSRITHTKHHEWNHSIPDVINALVGAGMVIDKMEEHQRIEWPFVESCTHDGEAWFLPDPFRSTIPTTFSLWAHKGE